MKELKHLPHWIIYFVCCIRSTTRKQYILFHIPLTIQLKWFARWASNLRFDFVYEFGIYIFSICNTHCFAYSCGNQKKRIHTIQFCILCAYANGKGGGVEFEEKKWHPNTTGKGLIWIKALICFSSIFLLLWSFLPRKMYEHGNLLQKWKIKWNGTALHSATFFCDLSILCFYILCEFVCVKVFVVLLPMVFLFGPYPDLLMNINGAKRT